MRALLCNVNKVQTTNKTSSQRKKTSKPCSKAESSAKPRSADSCEPRRTMERDGGDGGDGDTVRRSQRRGYLGPRQQVVWTLCCVTAHIGSYMSCVLSLLSHRILPESLVPLAPWVVVSKFVLKIFVRSNFVIVSLLRLTNKDTVLRTRSSRKPGRETPVLIAGDCPCGAPSSFF